jgi:hypothetical protein
MKNGMRKKILSLHLLLASFMAPAFIMVAISGGLYLIGIKGANIESEVRVPEQFSLDLDSNELEQDVRNIVAQLNLNINFEYLRIRGSSITTRPTSREFLRLSVTDDGLRIKRVSPNLQSSLMELHKGHGPTLFKTYQKLVAVALMFVMLSGLWMGISNKMMRKKTLITATIGLATFILLALS